MSRKLQSLLKTLELSEREAIQHRGFVEGIVEQRRRKVELKKSRLLALKERLLSLAKARRSFALQRGDLQAAASHASYSKRLESDVHRIESQLLSLRRELAVAEERSEQAEHDLLEARLERKKVEQLLEQQSRKGRLRIEALDAERVDELAQYRAHMQRTKNKL